MSLFHAVLCIREDCCTSTGEQTWESDTQSSVPVRDARRVGGSSDRAHDSTFGLNEIPEVLHQA